MKRVGLFLLVAFTCLGLHAQSIKWGAAITLEAKTMSELNVHKFGTDGFHTLLYDGDYGHKTVVYEYYDHKMKKKVSEKVFAQDARKENKKAVFIYSMDLEDGILLVFKDRKKKKSAYPIFGMKIDYKGNVLLDRFEITNEYTSGAFLSFDLMPTADGGFITFEKTFYPTSVRKKLKTGMKEFVSFTYKVFDKDGNIKQEIAKHLPGTKSRYSMIGIPYNKKSKAFYCIVDQKMSMDEKKGKGKLDAKTNTLILIPEEEEFKMHKLKIQDENHALFSSSYSVDDNGNLVKTSTFIRKDDDGESSKKKKKKSLDKTIGYYVQVWDAALEEITNYEIPFTEDVMKLALGAKKFNKNPSDAHAPKQYVREVIHDKEGNVYIFSEYYRLDVVTRTYTSGNTTRTETDYYYTYGDVIVAKVSPEGEMLSMNLVPKYQYSKNDGGMYSGYYATLVNNKPRIFWRELEKNVPFLQKWDNADEDDDDDDKDDDDDDDSKDKKKKDKEKDKKKKKDKADKYQSPVWFRTDAGIIMASFNEDGSAAYKMVEKSLKNQPSFRRWENYYHEDVGVMFVCRDNKKTRFGLLNLEEKDKDSKD